MKNWNFDASESAKLAEFDTVLTFTTFSNAQEIAGSLVAMASLATNVEGVIVDDFFEGRLIASHEAIDWARRKLPNARSQFDGPSQIRKAMSSNQGAAT